MIRLLALAALLCAALLLWEYRWRYPDQLVRWVCPGDSDEAGW